MKTMKLLFLTSDHVVVGVVSHSKQMGWHLCPLLALVLLHHVLAVHRQSAVGVDGNAEQTGVGLQAVLMNELCVGMMITITL